MTNAQMKPNRFLRWHEARTKRAWMAEQIAAGRTVYIMTMTRGTKITAKTLALVTAEKSGLYIQNGKRRENCDFCGLVAR